jgi:hypothetical protein
MEDDMTNKGKIKPEDMTNEEKVKAIKRWQKNDMVHPLTCGKDSSHILEASIGEKGVFLKCPKCNYTQDWIPEVVFDGFNWENEMLKVLKRKEKLREGKGDFCVGCIFHPCADCDEDTITLDCDYKATSKT